MGHGLRAKQSLNGLHQANRHRRSADSADHDYEEDPQRREQLEALDALVPEFEGHQRIRVLLLARSIGEWWTKCRQGQKKLVEKTDFLQLHAIVSSAGQRSQWFREAVETFALRAAGAESQKIPATDTVKKLTAQELEKDRPVRAPAHTADGRGAGIDG